jgi:hypothetical protein
MNTFTQVYLTTTVAANGWRYPLVGGTRQRNFDGINFKPQKLPENAQSPSRPAGSALVFFQGARFVTR